MSYGGYLLLAGRPRKAPDLDSGSTPDGGFRAVTSKGDNTLGTGPLPG